MAAKKTLPICCPDVLRERLAEALRIYTDAAYPEGGSDCAQVSRAALLDTVAKLQETPDPDTGCVEVNRRLRAMFKSAVNFYIDRIESESNQTLSAYRELLLQLVRGEVISEEMLEAALPPK